MRSAIAFGAAGSGIDHASNDAKAVEPAASIVDRAKRELPVSAGDAHNHHDKGTQLTDTLANRTGTHPLKDVSFKNE